MLIPRVPLYGRHLFWCLRPKLVFYKRSIGKLSSSIIINKKTRQRPPTAIIITMAKFCPWPMHPVRWLSPKDGLNIIRHTQYITTVAVWFERQYLVQSSLDPTNYFISHIMNTIRIRTTTIINGDDVCYFLLVGLYFVKAHDTVVNQKCAVFDPVSRERSISRISRGPSTTKLSWTTVLLVYN